MLNKLSEDKGVRKVINLPDFLICQLQQAGARKEKLRRIEKEMTIGC